MKIQLKRSNVLETGKAKVPTSAQLDYGELAVNYNADDPTLFLKDSNDNVIKFGGTSAYDDRYVQRAGDNMTGSLTFGTDGATTPNITLDSTGSATFAGDVQLAGNAKAGEAGIKLEASGLVSAARAGTAADGAGLAVFGGYKAGSSTATSSIRNDGSASFAGNVGIGTTSPDERLVVKGSAEAGYPAQFTDSSESNFAKIYVDSNGIGFVKNNFDDGIEFASNSARIYANGSERLRIGSSGHVQIGGNIPASPNTILYADGSAEFSGRVDIGGDISTTSAVRIYDTGNIYIRSNNTDTAKSIFKYFNQGYTDNDVKIDFKTNGSATFAADVNVGNRNPGSSSSAGTRIANESGVSGVYTQSNSSVNQSSIAFQALRGTDEIFKVSYDGSATFAGSIQSAGNPDDGGANGFKVSNGKITATRDSTADLFLGYTKGNSTPTSTITANGSASFAGDVNQGESWDRTANQRSVLIVDGAVYTQRNSTDGSNPVFRGTLSTTDSSDAAITSQINADGSATFVGTVNAANFNSTSDIALKQDITSIDGALSRLSNIEGVGFAWKKTGARTYGVIAQDVEKEFPELVHTDEFKSVNYNGLVGVLIEAIKELKAEVEELKKG